MTLAVCWWQQQSASRWFHATPQPPDCDNTFLHLHTHTRARGGLCFLSPEAAA